ncbi:O-acetyl-ADP-ribose deacetylase [Photobacterium ganghwense]|uniref:O-acetyl-ADP-ribose deacetylase n=2 Tax=Photobacterium ganghwense TaxID=320778 RepID=UPI001C2CD46F|nr:O-acetyl-ADP-ribose deacetylase [Photobacterium ganghwense]MBV1839818.1 O-acetyl-ADP-ribose deacetylase [Photobacterium ganghwense]
MSQIMIIEGDITKAKVDAIVNAANPVMLGGGGVDGAIHQAAGPALRQACLQVPAYGGVRCPTGEARITSAGNLSAKYVIHTVGPVYDRVSNPAALLGAAYEHSLQLALEHQCQTIAFPAISCGVYGYPHDEAAEVAFSVCRREAYSHLQIYFYLMGKSMVSLWKQILNAKP